MLQLRVVEMNIAHQGLLRVKGTIEAVGFEYVANPAVAALDQAIGLRGLWRREAVFDAQLSAELVILMGSGWCPCS